MKTPTIVFNVNDRQREFRGQSRAFDVNVLCSVINGGDVQERIKNRDMWGYYGHLPRRLFGMTPGEGGIYQGRHVRVEPALVSTMVRAEPDGTIRHEAEFLDTPGGRSAQRLFNNRSGGFSSAIKVDLPASRAANRDVPEGFFGFDYVAEPNYAGNRGFALDGVENEDGSITEEMLLDDAMQESHGSLVALDRMYSGLQADYDRLVTSLTSMQRENEELLYMLDHAKSVKAAPSHAQLLGQLARLDSVGSAGTSRRGAPSIADRAAAFKGVPLPELQGPAVTQGDREASRHLKAALRAITSIGRR